MNYKEKTGNFVNDNKIFSDLEKYVELIEEYNKSMNLTGFKGDRLWEEAIYESILLLDKHINNEESLADIGAGAGFPSIPYLIFNRSIKLTIIEPLLKRIKFLQVVKEKLSLNMEFLNQRAEKIKDIKFDKITARAVAKLPILVEISHNLLKNHGEMIFIKGPNVSNEIKESNFIFNELKIKNVKVIKYDSINKKEQSIVKIVKISSDNHEYPREWSKIIKQYKK